MDAWPLCVGGEWIEGREADVDAYDAGTDSGPTFLSPNQPESSVVTNFRDTMPLSDSIFFDPATCAPLVFPAPPLLAYSQWTKKNLYFSYECSSSLLCALHAVRAVPEGEGARCRGAMLTVGNIAVELVGCE